MSIDRHDEDRSDNLDSNIEVIVAEDWEGESSTTVRPASPEARKVAQAYLDKLKKWRPKEYEELMRDKEPGKDAPPPA